MKTAEEWIQWFDENSDCIASEGPSNSFLKEFITKIQVDALRHAAILCANSDNHLCGIAAIENEATKLESK